MPESTIADKLERIKHLLGTQPDHALAKEVGAPAAVVARYRRKLGIPASAGRNDAMSAGESGTETKRTRKRGRPAKAASAAPRKKGQRGRQSKLDAFRSIIGKVPDREVAERAGVSTEGVRMYRKRHDIPLEGGARQRGGRGAPAPRRARGASGGEGGGGEGPRRRISKLDPFRELLGTIPDRELAEKAGVTAENVRAYRRRHNIEATWREEGGEVPGEAQPSKRGRRPAPAAARHLSRSPRPASSLQGYAIHVSVGATTHEYMIIAADISSAAELAVSTIRSRHPNGEITAIRHLGPALAT